MIKYNRAKKISVIGINHASFKAMWDAIPQEVKSALNSGQLAQLVDANWGLAQKSKAIADRAAIKNGFVWDANHQVSINLAN
jgi:hypothetical protein